MRREATLPFRSGNVSPSHENLCQRIPAIGCIDIGLGLMLAMPGDRHSALTLGVLKLPCVEQNPGQQIAGLHDFAVAEAVLTNSKSQGLPAIVLGLDPASSHQ